MEGNKISIMLSTAVDMKLKGIRSIKQYKGIFAALLSMGMMQVPVFGTLDQLGWCWFRYPWVYSSSTETWTYMVPTDYGMWLNDTGTGFWRFQASDYEWSYGDLRPTIDAYVDRVIYVEDSWAGQSFIVLKNDEAYSVRWRVHGSGVPIVDEFTVPAQLNSPYQIQFTVFDDIYKMGIYDAGRIKVFVDGIRIYARPEEVIDDAKGLENEDFK